MPRFQLRRAKIRMVSDIASQKPSFRHIYFVELIPTTSCNYPSCFRTTSSSSEVQLLVGGPFVSAMTITVVISEVVHSCAIDYVPM